MLVQLHIRVAGWQQGVAVRKVLADDGSCNPVAPPPELARKAQFALLDACNPRHGSVEHLSNPCVGRRCPATGPGPRQRRGCSDILKYKLRPMVAWRIKPCLSG